MKKFVSYLLVVALVFMLASCAGNQSTSSPNGTAPASDYVKGIRMGMNAKQQLDPALAMNWTGSYTYVNLYDTLVTPASDNSGKMMPMLAESWEMADDALSYTFHLKKGVKFHHGGEVKAKDIRFTWQRLMTLGTGFAFLYKQTIEDVVADDDYTVTFKLKQKYGPFVETLVRLYILSEDEIMKNLKTGTDTDYGEFADYGRTYLLENDAGSGPYAVTEVSTGNYTIAEKFEDYHIPFPENAPAFVQWITVSEVATQRTMLANRELDISLNQQSPENYEAYDSIEGVGLGRYSNGTVNSQMINNKKAPTDDANIRKALACLMDYEALIDAAYPGSVQAVSPINRGVPGADAKRATPAYKYDIEQAKAYIAQSKYANNIGDYPVEYFVVSTIPYQEKIALALQAAASQVGIKIELVKGPYNNQVELISKQETTPNIICSGIAPYFWDAGSTFQAQYTSDSVGTTANSMWLLDETLEKKVYDALAIPDVNERYAKYAEIESICVENCYSVYSFDVTDIMAYQEDYLIWPADKYYRDNGKLNYNLFGYQFWFHDWQILPH